MFFVILSVSLRYVYDVSAVYIVVEMVVIICMMVCFIMGMLLKLLSVGCVRILSRIVFKNLSTSWTSKTSRALS